MTTASEQSTATTELAEQVAPSVVCTAVAFPLWFALIARVGAARAALVTYASPLVAVALGVALLGEQPGRLAPLGLALILAGSWLAARPRNAMHPEQAPSGPSRTERAQRAVAT